jgi:hypothetical protein
VMSSADDTVSMDADINSALKRIESTFGSKTDKISKFYDIMMRAEGLPANSLSATAGSFSVGAGGAGSMAVTSSSNYSTDPLWRLKSSPSADETAADETANIAVLPASSSTKREGTTSSGKHRSSGAAGIRKVPSSGALKESLPEELSNESSMKKGSLTSSQRRQAQSAATPSSSARKLMQELGGSENTSTAAASQLRVNTTTSVRLTNEELRQQQKLRNQLKLQQHENLSYTEFTPSRKPSRPVSSYRGMGTLLDKFRFNDASVDQQTGPHGSREGDNRVDEEEENSGSSDHSSGDRRSRGSDHSFDDEGVNRASNEASEAVDDAVEKLAVEERMHTEYGRSLHVEDASKSAGSPIASRAASKAISISPGQQGMPSISVDHSDRDGSLYRTTLGTSVLIGDTRYDRDTFSVDLTPALSIASTSSEQIHSASRPTFMQRVKLLFVSNKGGSINSVVSDRRQNISDRAISTEKFEMAVRNSTYSGSRSSNLTGRGDSMNTMSTGRGDSLNTITSTLSLPAISAASSKDSIREVDGGDTPSDKHLPVNKQRNRKIKKKKSAAKALSESENKVKSRKFLTEPRCSSALTLKKMAPSGLQQKINPWSIEINSFWPTSYGLMLQECMGSLVLKQHSPTIIATDTFQSSIIPINRSVSATAAIGSNNNRSMFAHVRDSLDDSYATEGEFVNQKRASEVVGSEFVATPLASHEMQTFDRESSAPLTISKRKSMWVGFWGYDGSSVADLGTLNDGLDAVSLEAQVENASVVQMTGNALIPTGTLLSARPHLDEKKSRSLIAWTLRSPATETDKVLSHSESLLNMQTTFSLKKNVNNLRDFIMLNIENGYLTKWIWYLLRRQLLGVNVKAYGPKYSMNVIGFALLILCIGDIGLWVITLIEMVCLSDDATECEDHTAVTLAMGIWPLAFIISPLMGITAVMLGPSGPLTRIYASWARLAALNNCVIIYYFINYFEYFFNQQPASYYPVIGITISRTLQVTFVDQYVAHLEQRRFTRGWDGLHTTLYKTKDTKMTL